MHEAFARWNEGVLDSYLIEITRDVLGTYDADGQLVLDLILDRAGQKGTGRWTAVAALEQGQPLTLITEAVFARALSSMKDARERAAAVLPGPDADFVGDADAFLTDLEQALYAAKIVSYTQGYMLLRSAVREHGWSTDMAATARVWRGGCIIRSRFLNDITAAFEAEPELENLLLAPFFRDAVAHAQAAWRRVVAEAARLGVPGARHGGGAVVLRRPAHRPRPRQPAAGPARLLRRPHLRARRPAARRGLPHRLDREWGGGDFADVRRLGRRRRSSVLLSTTHLRSSGCGAATDSVTSGPSDAVASAQCEACLRRF
jgi:hypothetical protein